jgi:uncharacterized membrane protein YhaH (DUF805 family)
MTFIQAIKSCFRQYVGFSGRASRSEYWYWILFCFLAGIVTSTLDNILFDIDPHSHKLGPISFIFELATFLPGVAVGFRRLHDVNRSAWWSLIALTIIGIIFPLFIWNIRKGTDGPNRFDTGYIDNSVQTNKTSLFGVLFIIIGILVLLGLVATCWKKLLFWLAFNWDSFGSIRDADYAISTVCQVSFILAPLSLIAILLILPILRSKNTLFYFTQILVIISALVGLYFTAKSIGPFANKYGAPDWGKPLMFFAPGVFWLMLRPVWAILHTFEPKNSSSSKKPLIVASAIIASLYLASYTGTYIANLQHIVIQIVDTQGKPIPDVELVATDSHSSSRSDALGRVGFDVDMRTDFNPHHHDVKKAPYTTTTISVDNGAFPSEGQVMNFVNDLLYGSVHTSHMIPIVTRVEYSTEALPYGTNYLSLFLPRKKRLLLTVIMPDKADPKTPNYEKALFGPLLSDENSPQLRVDNLTITEEDLDAPDVLERLKKKYRHVEGDFNLSHTPLTDATFQKILSKNSEPIYNLNLSSTHITDVGVAAVPLLTELKDLNLAQTAITDTGLKAMNSQPALTRINLANTAITNEGMKELSKHPGLSVIDITNTSATCPDGKFGVCYIH